MAKLRIGSRGSKLALWQASHVAALLRGQGHAVEIEVIKTTGDKITDVALARVGTKGMFTKEIEEALAGQRVDLAVHSLKDVPTELAPEFELAAIMKREDPGDAFLSVKAYHLHELRDGARIGTSSLRRQCQLKAFRPGLEIVSLRGNIDTRLKKLETGEYDAIVLAVAGVQRLGLDKYMRHRISPETMCPAAGQGALAIEIRRDDQETRLRVAFLNDALTRQAVQCERAVLKALGGGCQVPIGAHAELTDPLRHEWGLDAMVGRPDGSEVLRETRAGEDTEELVRVVTERLLQRGADRILREVYTQKAATPEMP